MGMVLCGVLLASVTASCRAQDEAGVERPNLLFVITDDMAVSDLVAMPHLGRWMVDEGTSFTRAYVSVSLCCPSRATMLRGQYAHNTGVLSNEGSNGGFPVAHHLGIEASTVATWLQDAGYRTALIGKYLNDYPETAADNYVPPGWDEWAAPVGVTPESDGNIYNQYDYILNDNGELVEYGDAPEDYASRVYTDRIRRFIEESADADQPFFAHLSLPSPHVPATPDPRDAGAEVATEAPRTPSFNEPDVSDKPQWVQELGPFNAFDQTYIDGLHEARQRANLGVDRAIGQVVDRLRRAGELDHTWSTVRPMPAAPRRTRRSPNDNHDSTDDDHHRRGRLHRPPPGRALRRRRTRGPRPRSVRCRAAALRPARRRAGGRRPAGRRRAR